ncbi:MAG: amidohydrolase [Flavobacteriaceae bacterium]|nr:amidohydrolase [Flavobacteriaceae bacterium]
MIEKAIHKDLSNWIIELRRFFHKYPELSYEEFNTQQKVISILNELGIENKVIAGTGVLGVIDTGKPGKTIALRADMDALKINEEHTEHNKEYVSINKGIMHACGHDGHMVMLLGAAKLLKNNEEHLKGKVKFIFQPAEEIPPGGAIKVIKEGGLKGVDAVVGMHLFTYIESGIIYLKEGAFMASHCKYEVTITGKSGHHFRPEENIDPVQIASKFVSTIQTDIKSNFAPTVRYVFGFGTIHGGEQFNQTPTEVKISGSYRVLGEAENLAIIKNTICKNLDGLMLSHKRDNSDELPTYNLTVSPGYPSLINSSKFTKSALNLLSKQFSGVSNNTESVLASEDFSRYLEEVPGTFIFVGAGNKEMGLTHENHSNKFDIDENVLIKGAESFYHLTVGFLKNPNEFI